jgi:hypothetical protein
LVIIDFSDLLADTNSAVSVGAAIGILYPGDIEAVLAAQAVFAVIAALGYVVVRRRRLNPTILGQPLTFPSSSPEPPGWVGQPGWFARRWLVAAYIWRLVLVALVAGLALINATGVYAQLVAAHVGERGAAMSVIETQGAALIARIDVQAHAVADLDARVAQIDATIAEATRRGRTNTALAAMEAQKKARAGLVDERKREASTLAALKAERASVVAKGRQIETEAAPIRYVAEMLGSDTDSERAIRWLIALIVLCCDPLAIALTAAASARRSTT